MEWAFDAISLEWIRKHSVCVRAQFDLWLWSAFGINFLVAIKSDLISHTETENRVTRCGKGSLLKLNGTARCSLCVKWLKIVASCRDLVALVRCVQIVRYAFCASKQSLYAARPRSRNGYIRAEPFDFDRNHTYQPASMRMKCYSSNQKCF